MKNIISRDFFVLVILFSSFMAQAVVIKDNGIIGITLGEENYPMITSMRIQGVEIVPHDNAGADFQFTGRKPAVGDPLSTPDPYAYIPGGDAYNPTQGGDCWGYSSTLTGYILNWNSGYGVPASNGILWAVQPLNYNEPNGNCSPGSLLPYSFNMGVTLGDGVHLPKEMMVMTMSIRKNDVNAPNLLKRHSEIPVAFPLTSFMRYAYFSNNGVDFEPMYLNGTHDIQQWENSAPNSRVGKVVMLSNIDNAHTNPSSGTGMAFYSHTDTWLIVQNRGYLTLVSTLGALNYDTYISDSNWHTLVRVMGVGNLNTIKGVIAKANEKITSWGNWY